MKAGRGLHIACPIIALFILGSTFILFPVLSYLTSSPFWRASWAQEPVVKGFVEYHGDQRVLNLWGTHYDMGYAHGYLLASEIVEMIEKYMIEERDGNDPSLYTSRLSTIRDHFFFDPDTYGLELQGMLDGTMDRRVDLYLDVMGREVNLLDLKALNSMAAYGDKEAWSGDQEDDEEQIEVEGPIENLPSTPRCIGTWVVAGVTIETNADTKIEGRPAIGQRVRVRARRRGGKEVPLATEIEEAEGCSSFAAWDGVTSGGGTLTARNLDWRYDEKEGVAATYGLLITYDAYHPEENDFVAVSWPGVIGCPTCFNEHGVFLSHNYGNGRRQLTRDDYVPATLITRKAIEVADHEDPINDVLSVVLNSPRAGSAILLVAYPSQGSDQDGAQVIEYDVYGAEIRESGYDFPSYEHIIATNHFIQRYTPYAPWSASVTRYETITNDLLGYYATDDHVVNDAEAEQILRDVMGYTLHSVIAHPDEGSYEVYFARVSGYNPVQFAPAPYTPTAPRWTMRIKTQSYQWAELFPEGSNHGGLSPYPILTHGPVVGAVTASSAKVWARTSAAASVTIRYCTDPQMSVSCQESTSQSTALDADYTAQVLLEGLSPSTTYYYDVLIDGASQFGEPYPQFKTFPEADTLAPLKVVVLNDFHTAYMDPPQVDTFTNASAEHPDVVIIGGDFDHRNPRSEGEKRQMFKALYSRADTYEDFVDHILRKYPVAHIWDDHDYGEENADKTYPYKALSLKVLRESFPLYSIGDAGIWQKFTYGQVDFFLLDSRSQRDPNTQPDGPDKSMLDGDNLETAGQLEWLKDGLLNSTATWKVIATPSVFNPTSGKDDSWASFQYERQHLLDFISSNHITGVILVAGDMHFGAIDDGSHSGLPEMEVPSPNVPYCLTWDNTGTWSEGVYYEGHDIPCLGYGVLTFQTDPDQALLEVKDDQGQTVISHLISPAPPADTMHVASIAMSLRKRWGYRRAKASVLIVDQEGAPVSGALVTGEWSGLTSDSDNGTTGADGTVALASDWAKKRGKHGTFTFTVTDVTAPGYLYDPSANGETSNSISW